jgi:3'-phosphoadenosine 5'-phosphosulfate (PAPS) 3'-phosphatase
MAYEKEIAVAVAAAHQAGALALGMQQGVSVETKADASPVTEADKAADAHIRRELTAAFPDDAILSEEAEDDGHRHGASRVWIVDPIDGTKGFIEGKDQWAVQVALAVDGALALGVLAVPGAGRLWMGGPGLGCTLWEGDPGTQARRDDGQAITAEPGAEVLALSHRQFTKPDPMLARAPDAPRSHCHSVGFKVDVLLRQEARWYIHPRSLSEWDVAAPAAVLLGAGGDALAINGQPLAFNTADGRCDGLIFSTVHDGAAIAAALAG